MITAGKSGRKPDLIYVNLYYKSRAVIGPTFFLAQTIMKYPILLFLNNSIIKPILFIWIIVEFASYLFRYDPFNWISLISFIVTFLADYIFIYLTEMKK